MLKVYSKIISTVLHPIFAPLFSLYVLFSLPSYINFKLSSYYKLYIYGIVVINLVIVPIVFSYYLKQKKQIRSLKMDSVKERIIPYGLSVLFYILTWVLLQKVQFPAFYLAVFQMAGVTVLILLVFALLKQKVSAHMAAWGGICGVIATSSIILEVDNINYLILAVLLSGLVGTARLHLKAHSMEEVLSGFILGLSLQLFILV